MVIMDVLIMATRPMVWIKIEHSGLFCPICLHIYFLSPHTIWTRTLQQISLSDISIFLNEHLPMNEYTWIWGQCPKGPSGLVGTNWAWSDDNMRWLLQSHTSCEDEDVTLKFTFDEQGSQMFLSNLLKDKFRLIGWFLGHKCTQFIWK